MNDNGESRKEAIGRTKEVLNAKTKTRIGFWNVRTMFETGKLAQVTIEMNRYNLHILGVSESRWTGTGRYKTNTGETVLYSGRDNNIHTKGVAIISKKGLEKSLMEWKSVNSRFIRIRLKGWHNNLNIIQCHAPTNDNEKDIKGLFYEQLQVELNEIPRNDVITLIGDLNAKVGDENIGAERTMGIHGCGSINNNSERLVELCASNDLVIGGTLFEHPAIHKLTWYSPNGRDKNQIDHIAINNIWRRSLLDVRVKRGADVGSDHLLVIASIRLKLRRTDRRDMHKKRLDVNKLKDPDVRKLFTIQLKNRFQALPVQENYSPQEMENINHLWNQVKTSYQDAGQLTLGHRSKKYKEWISQEAWKKIEERRDIKKKILATKSERLKHQQQQHIEKSIVM
ncbi:craniofacial development protein 2-like [Elysia marginata]|uniref:Craniofacial development protein 2-like n=1 Tax=Elysia marginata TaxID=1093978 RepID=A0AAV4IVI1_9GAST|nr:craniofacial development protein 2-like [Elysia marginata]